MSASARIETRPDLTYVPQPIGFPIEGHPMITHVAIVDLEGSGLPGVLVCDATANRIGWIRQHPTRRVHRAVHRRSGPGSGPRRGLRHERQRPARPARLEHGSDPAQQRPDRKGDRDGKPGGRPLPEPRHRREHLPGERCPRRRPGRPRPHRTSWWDSSGTTRGSFSGWRTSATGSSAATSSWTCRARS